MRNSEFGNINPNVFKTCSPSPEFVRSSISEGAYIGFHFALRISNFALGIISFAFEQICTRRKICSKDKSCFFLSNNRDIRPRRGQSCTHSRRFPRHSRNIHSYHNYLPLFYCIGCTFSCIEQGNTSFLKRISDFVSACEVFVLLCLCALCDKSLNFELKL